MCVKGKNRSAKKLGDVAFRCKKCGEQSSNPFELCKAKPQDLVHKLKQVKK